MSSCIYTFYLSYGKFTTIGLTLENNCPLNVLPCLKKIFFIFLTFYTISVVGFQFLSHSIKQTIKTVGFINLSLKFVRERARSLALICTAGQGRRFNAR